MLRAPATRRAVDPTEDLVLECRVPERPEPGPRLRRIKDERLGQRGLDRERLEFVDVGPVGDADRDPDATRRLCGADSFVTFAALSAALGTVTSTSSRVSSVVERTPTLITVPAVPSSRTM